MDGDNETTAEIHTAMVKLPPVWINKMKAQFNLRKITDDDTRYWHVVASLGDELAESASPIIEAPPATDKYTAQKNLLVKCFGELERTPWAKLCFWGAWVCCATS